MNIFNWFVQDKKLFKLERKLFAKNLPLFHQVKSIRKQVVSVNIPIFYVT